MPLVRCAIYTRKSSSEKLDHAFNSLDAQRADCEAFILSQRSLGWSAISKVYDDGGWSGGSLLRPALRSLLDDIEAGEVDVVVVYKIDRLTRSLVDFSQLVEVFERHRVSFVSVTQSFNTQTSMGRLTLNVLLSFAQFEREMTSERLRDKFAAARAKGLWLVGHRPLGYRIGEDKRLVIDPIEGKMVRQIYKRYSMLRSAAAVVNELNAKGCKTPLGRPFNRIVVLRLLSSRVYRGDLVYRGGALPGSHEPLVSERRWQAVQSIILERNRRVPRSDLMTIRTGGMAKTMDK